MDSALVPFSYKIFIYLTEYSLLAPRLRPRVFYSDGFYPVFKVCHLKLATTGAHCFPNNLR